MSPRLKEFLQHWLINTVAVLLAALIVPGIHYSTWYDLIIATFVLGMLNTFVRPLMLFLSLPLLIFTLGLFTLVINALLLSLVGWLLGPERFKVESFGQALLGALVISVVCLALNSLTGSGRARVELQRDKRPPSKKSDGDGGGPVIDV